jgi:2-keto-4-pentenoate hydratase/2-oxohepta-3-ene-1,7-dioic acid hydratase in catechol pathway
MVYGGKIYETDGSEAIGVHEAIDVRPLAPVPTPSSIRIFRSDLGANSDDPIFFYANPACLVGPSQVINLPDVGEDFVVRSYLGAVMVGGGYAITTEVAESLILGYTLVNILTSRSLEAEEKALGIGFGRSHDLGIAIGPVLTTPDELDDVMTMTKNGILFSLGSHIKINSVEKASASFEEFTISMIEAVRVASETCTLRAGDLFCVGPIFDDEVSVIEAGDEYQFTIERLGTLATKISNETE